ncbi:hypothetical protein V7799_01105 [Rhizobium laguerreae]
MAFKRFKSLAGLDSLPAKKPELARAWLYARLCDQPKVREPGKSGGNMQRLAICHSSL